MRTIVNESFTRASLPTYGPHAVRHMLARHAAKTATSVAEFVANSQSLGHTDGLTIPHSYSQISRERQRERITERKPND
ncbi:integrase [Roseovarius sp. MBR-51]